MYGKTIRKARFASLVVLFVALAASTALGQIIANPNQTPNTGGTVYTVPVPVIPQSNLTADQMKSIMLYRALQQRGSRGVRTGYPQFIPMGMGGMMPFPQAGAGNMQPQIDTSKQDAKLRRIEARKAAEEKKKAAKAAKAAKLKDAKAKKAAKPAAPAKDAQAANYSRVSPTALRRYVLARPLAVDQAPHLTARILVAQRRWQPRLSHVVVACQRRESASAAGMPTAVNPG